MKKNTALKYENLLNNGKSLLYWWSDIDNGVWVVKNSAHCIFKTVDNLKKYLGYNFKDYLKSC